MGVKQYNRGSQAIIRDLHKDDDAKMAFAVFDRLESIPKSENAVTPFCDLVIFEDNRGLWWADQAMNHAPHDGYFCPKHGYYFSSLNALMAHLHITITGYDFVTKTYRAIPKKRPNPACNRPAAFGVSDTKSDTMAAGG